MRDGRERGRPNRSGGGLAGITVGIPASRRAEETAALVRRWGGTPLIGPTLVETSLLEDARLQEATERVISSPAHWSVHLTGVGTHRWFEAAGGWGLAERLVQTLRRAQVVARGAKAASALRARGLEPAWVPPGETSEEIRGWLVERLAAGELVAVQLHGSAAPALTRGIEATGAAVVEIAPYRWELPKDLGPARRLVSALIAKEAQALVITSAPQIRHLFLLARDMGVDHELRRALGERVFIAAVGVVASRGVKEEGLQPDLVAQPPRLGALVRALAGARERILAKARAD